MLGLRPLERPARRLPVTLQLADSTRTRRGPECLHRERGDQNRNGSTARRIQNDIADMSAAAGMVRIHAQTIRPAIPQRTADRRLVAPTPTIDPVIVWVVLTGMPNRDAVRITMAPPVSAQKPPTGRRR